MQDGRGHGLSRLAGSTQLGDYLASADGKITERRKKQGTGMLRAARLRLRLLRVSVSN
jgi:hypothetical protein